MLKICQVQLLELMYKYFKAYLTKERFSIPFFFNPAHYTMVEPLQGLLDDHQNHAKYEAFNWGKFVAARNLSNFKKLDVENIQIYHFRKSDQ